MNGTTIFMRGGALEILVLAAPSRVVGWRELDLRRDLALARLAKTNDAVAKIATNLGYADTSTFYRAFAEWIGMAPSEYRRQLNRNNP